MLVRVVGVTFVDDYPENLYRCSALARQALGRGEPLPAVLIREPDNRADPQAVAVHVPAVGPVGHLPRWLAARLAPVLDEGGQVVSAVEEVLVQPDHPDRPGLLLRLNPVRQSA